MITHRCVEWSRCAVKMLSVIHGCRGRRRAAATREKVYWHQSTDGAVCRVTWCPVLRLDDITVVSIRWSRRWIWRRSTASRQEVNEERRRNGDRLLEGRLELVDFNDVAWCLPLTIDDGQVGDLGGLKARMFDVVFLDDGMMNGAWSERGSTKTWTTVLEPNLKYE